MVLKLKQTQCLAQKLIYLHHLFTASLDIDAFVYLDRNNYTEFLLVLPLFLSPIMIMSEQLLQQQVSSEGEPARGREN